MDKSTIEHPENDSNISAVDSLSGLLEGKLPDDYDAKELRKEHLIKS